MNTTHRLAPAVLAAFALAGCRSPLGPEMRNDSGVQVTFENAADTQVTIHPVLVSRLRDEHDRFTGPAVGNGSTIDPGSTLRYQIVTSPMDMEGRVLRILVERPSPSWEATPSRWFEVVGRIPARIRITPKDPLSWELRGEGAQIVEMPPQHVHSQAPKGK